MNTETLEHRLQLNPDELIYVRRIADRGIAMANAFRVFPDVITTLMDIGFCHKLHCPLRLREWLVSDDIAFAKDFTTLLQNWDRKNFVLLNGVKMHFAVNNNESRIIVPENIRLRIDNRH